MLKTVWIVGAGFSRSLGGPLLTDLFSQSSFEEISAVFQEETDAGVHNNLMSLLSPPKSQFSIQSAARWADPEVFLDFLARASAADGAERRRLFEIIGDASSPNRSACPSGRPQEIYDLARRYVAQRCASFCEPSSTGGERWAPYRTWAMSKVNCNHTVISFNYDRVIEVAGKGNIRQVLPGEVANLDADEPCLLKLHGSVDWERENDVITKCPNRRAIKPFLGTPGPGKQEVSTELAPLWRLASSRLKEATNIVVVGFRFASHDADIRNRILGAIGANERDNLAIDIVLGDNENDPSTRRVVGLFNGIFQSAGRVSNASASAPIGKRGRVRTWPLFAEDFIALWTPEWLAEPGPG